jgi:hypothetical protein
MEPFMRRTFTLSFAFLAAALCLLHYLGYDPRNMLLISFSVPLWFMVIFSHIRDIPLFVAYSLTIAFWIALGYWIDLLVSKRQKA